MSLTASFYLVAYSIQQNPDFVHTLNFQMNVIISVLHVYCPVIRFGPLMVLVFYIKNAFCCIEIKNCYKHSFTSHGFICIERQINSF